jgi:hypothetical protein
MSNILQLNPPIPCYVIDKGKGMAHFLIDYGIEHNLLWVVFMNDTGESWTVENSKFRIENNWSINRNVTSDVVNDDFNTIKERLIEEIDKKGYENITSECVHNCDNWEQLQQLIIDIAWKFNRLITLPDGYYKSSKREFTVVKGKLEGEFKEWWENGQLVVHCTFKDGKLYGGYKELDKYGVIIKDYTYKNGHIVDILV